MLLVSQGGRSALEAQVAANSFSAATVRSGPDSLQFHSVPPHFLIQSPKQSAHPSDPENQSQALFLSRPRGLFRLRRLQVESAAPHKSTRLASLHRARAGDHVLPSIAAPGTR